ncbi:MAG: carbohydrate-binding protein [Algibacter sp.]
MKTKLTFINNDKVKVLYIVFMFFTMVCFSQTTVNSLQELLPYLDDDNVDIKLTPGVYTIDNSNIANFTNPIFLFEGNDNSFDFTGVTINFATEIFSSFGNVSVEKMAIVGNENVITNLTMVDVGSVYDRPYRGALGIRMDGEDNKIEGITMTVKGSEPYGYGDMFGKGVGYIIKPFKHAAIQLRGNRNHIKDCDIIHRAYGHGIFMQGSYDALIEGVTMEGEVRTTDDMLAETGTGTAGDLQGFITILGYKLPAGYMLSLQEDGIRAYNSGDSYINGVLEEDRRTTNITVRDCTVKNMRNGVTLALSAGDVQIERCTVLGCETGYSVGASTNIVDCSGDIIYGEIYINPYSRSGINADIEILPGSDDYYYGSTSIAYLAGANNNITFRNSETSIDENLHITAGGVRDGLRYKSEENEIDYDASGHNLNNYSDFPVLLSSKSSDNNIVTCGTVIDNGTNNSIIDCNTPNICGNYNAFTTIQAEVFCSQSGIQTANSNAVGYINTGDWVKYENIDFGSGVNSIEISAGTKTSGGNIEIRAGSVSGNLLGTVEITNTGSFTSWQTFKGSINGISGAQDVYFVFTGGDGYLFDVNWFKFSSTSLSISDFNTDISNKPFIYPNPVSSTTTIQKANNSTLSIYDINGNIVFTQVLLSDKDVVDLSRLATGIYFAEAKTASSRLVMKLVKE